MNQKPSVLISVITRENLFAGTARWLTAQQYPVDIVQTYAPIVHNRNLQVKRFLESGLDHIFFLDSDTVPQDGTAEELVEAAESDEVPTIHCAPSWAYDSVEVFPSAYKETRLGFYSPVVPIVGGGVLEVDACGMSGTLVPRKVFSEHVMAWFHAETDSYGHWHSEDFNFFKAVRDSGIKVFAHLDLIAEHHKPMNLGEVERLIEARTQSSPSQQPVHPPQLPPL